MVMENRLPTESPLNLHTLSTITKSLESIVLELYGPHGYQVLLSASTGHVIVTNDSSSILKSLHLSHPVARFIVQSMINTCNITSDGGKTFIIYLSEMLENIKRDFYLDSRHGHGEEIHTDRLTKTKAALSLQLFLKTIYPCVVERVQSILHSDYKDEVLFDVTGKPYLYGAIKNVLSPHFTPKLTGHFTKVLYEMFAEYSAGDKLFFALQTAADNFDTLHCKVPNQPYSTTKSINSVIIQRDFAVYSECLRQNNVKFIICQFSMTAAEEGYNSREIISIRSESEATKFILHQPQKLKFFLDRCVLRNIKLVLSREKFPDYGLHLFKERNISLIHCILEEDFECLKLMTKKHSVNDINEEINDNFIAVANSCSPIEIGIRGYVHLDLGTHVPRSLLICAPTDGLCTNLSVMFHKAIKYLCSSLNRLQTLGTVFESEKTDSVSSIFKMEKTKPSSSDFERDFETTHAISSVTENGDLGVENFQVKPDKLLKHVKVDSQSGIILQKSENHFSSSDVSCKDREVSFSPGGGSLEFIIAKILFDMSKKTSNFEFKIICKLIGDALMKIPVTLHKNNSVCHVSMRTQEFLQIKQNVFKKLEEGQILGINFRGQAVDMWKENVTESLHCKFYIISSVLQTLIQLLKIDAIIGVKQIKGQ